MKAQLAIGILALSLVAHPQTISKYSQHVTITGNSIAQYQAGFGPYEFPAVQQSGVYIWGQDGFTCADLEPES